MSPSLRFLLALGVAALLALPGCDTVYQFDDVRAGAGDSDRPPRARSNSQFVRAVYADLLGRAPEQYEFVVSAGPDELFRLPIAEQQFLLAVLEGIGDPGPMRALLVAGLVESEEVALPGRVEVDDPEAFIRAQFRHYLGREPNLYELRAFLDEWAADPAVNPRTVVRALIGSREYQSF